MELDSILLPTKRMSLLVFVRFHTLKLTGSDETKSRQRRYFAGMRKRSRMRA
jgi:hypothetical protein